MTSQASKPCNYCFRDFLESSIGAHPSLPAILAPDRKTLSYDRLGQHINQVVSVLNQWGFGTSDRIALILPNSPEMAVAFLSVAAGFACAPLNPAYQEKENRFYLKDINARAVIVQKDLDASVRQVAGQLGIPVIELVPQSEEEAGLFQLEFTGKNKVSARPGLSGPDDTALVLHTSGTTARPKMVPLSQRNIFTSAHNIGVSLQLSASDCCLNVMPLFHIHGLIAALLSSLAAGGSVVCTPGYSDARFFKWLDTFKPTWYTAVPTIHQRVLELVKKQPSTAQQAQLRFIRSSSSPLPPAVMRNLEDKFNVPAIEAYGMTEAAHQMASNPLPPLERKPGSVGLPAGPEVAIMDEIGNLIDTGGTGEIVIHGENVMRAYVNNPAANKTAFSGKWFRTGDLGYLDEDGYLFISGRLKEIINRGGQKVSPREIGDVLLEHPGVRQALAFSVPHLRLGEAIAAVVVVDPEKNFSEKELRQYVADRLAAYKIPQQIGFVDNIPKGTTGKLQRIGMAEKLSLFLNPDYTRPETKTEILVAECWKTALQLKKVGREDNFFAVGGDSLSAVQAVLEINQAFGSEIPVLTLFQLPKLVDFARSLDLQVSLAPDKPTDRKFYTLCPVQTDGSGPPFFWFHSGEIRFLPASLGKDQPIYALIGQGIDGNPPRYKTAQAIAMHYIKEIQAVQPAGPYYLGGFCWGALVAFDVANRMMLQGQDVNLLFLVEPLLMPAEAAQRRTIFYNHSVYNHLTEIAQRTFPGKMKYVTRQLIVKMPIIKALSTIYPLIGRHLPDWLRSLCALSFIHRAYRHYEQPSFAKEIIIIQAAKGNRKADSDWRNLTTGRVAAHVIPGTRHLDLFQEPHISRWGGLLAEYFLRARQEHTDAGQ